MNPSYRKISARDVDGLFTLRSSVQENPFSVAELAAIGITPESTRAALGNNLDGYLCEMSGRVVGFAMGDLRTGEFSVIAVSGDYERRGIGRELLRLTEGLLWEAGHASLWLWTGADPTTRALRLYSSAGWVETETKNGRLYLKKDLPPS